MRWFVYGVKWLLLPKTTCNLSLHRLWRIWKALGTIVYYSQYYNMFNWSFQFWVKNQNVSPWYRLFCFKQKSLTGALIDALILNCVNRKTCYGQITDCIHASVLFFFFHFFYLVDTFLSSYIIHNFTSFLHLSCHGNHFLHFKRSSTQTPSTPFGNATSVVVM